jgi:hypothetical protein
MEGLPRHVRARVGGEDPLSIVGMEELDEERRVGGPFLDRIAEHRLDLRARIQVRARAVDAVDVDGQRELLDERSIAGLRQPDRIVGALSLGDVKREALAQRRAALRRLDVRGNVLEPIESRVCIRYTCRSVALCA